MKYNTKQMKTFILNLNYVINEGKIKSKFDPDIVILGSTG